MKKKKLTKKPKKKKTITDVGHTDIALIKEISFCFDLYAEETIQSICNLLLFISPIILGSFFKILFAFLSFCYYFLMPNLLAEETLPSARIQT